MDSVELLFYATTGVIGTLGVVAVIGYRVANHLDRKNHTELLVASFVDPIAFDGRTHPCKVRVGNEQDMAAKTLRDHRYSAYRARLQILLEIPESASNLEIHTKISQGLSTARLMWLAEEGVMTAQEREEIIPLGTLKDRIERDQPLTVEESDRLFRSVHITAMAEAVFGNADKAKRWLSKPKEQLSGLAPMQLLTTQQGTRQVEEMLLQVAEGIAL
jgi:putative toxin-antitoxin system antitoxin component (TIGR02293 family)